jgi:hypothetical protein
MKMPAITCLKTNPDKPPTEFTGFWSLDGVALL